MATQDLTTGTGTTNFHSDKRTSLTWQKIVDFSTITVTNGDVLKLINIPAGAVVVAAGVEVITAATAATTATVGDAGTSGTRYMTATAVSTVGLKAPTTVGPFYYGSADTLNTTIAGASPTVGKLRYWVVIEDVSQGRLPATAAVV